jgi:MauM/NapG family ferredoxin protein
MPSEATVSRRDLLSGRFLRWLRKDEAAEAKTSPQAPSRRPATALPLLRPPRAVPEADFLSLCSQCEACSAACPHDAIVRAPDRYRAAAGTPMIDPIASPCLACSDTPCVQACAYGALDPERPMRMGTARISPLDCLAHQGGMCSICVERCPVPGAMRREAGKPVIDEDACVGCGVCQHVCPAPVNAVLVLPARER